VRQNCGTPSKHKTQNVGQVVAGVCHQSCGIGKKSINKLNHHKNRIQGDGDCECPSLGVRVALVEMPMMTTVVMIVFRHVTARMMSIEIVAVL
jgi:hypothetical protein